MDYVNGELFPLGVGDVGVEVAFSRLRIRRDTSCPDCSLLHYWFRRVDREPVTMSS